MEILYWILVCIKSNNCLMYITLTVLIHFVIDCTVQSTKKNTVHWSLADIVVHTIHNGWNKLNDRNKRESKYSLIRSWCYSMTTWKISLRLIYAWWGSLKALVQDQKLPWPKFRQLPWWINEVKLFKKRWFSIHSNFVVLFFIWKAI